MNFRNIRNIEQLLKKSEDTSSDTDYLLETNDLSKEKSIEKDPIKEKFIKEHLLEKELFRKAYPGFLENAVSVSNDDVEYDKSIYNWKKIGECEQCSFEYAKNRDLQVVIGYTNDGTNIHRWIQHWWVYDKSRDKHIEVTFPKPDYKSYRMGIIIDKSILDEANKWQDVYFLLNSKRKDNEL